MRNAYIVSYDISDPKRLRKVFKAMKGFGEHLQYSVFHCPLTPREKAILISTVHPLINNKEDQVLIIDLGPADGRAKNAIESLGKPYSRADIQAVVI